jgi:PAS domain-containing protein
MFTKYLMRGIAPRAKLVTNQGRETATATALTGQCEGNWEAAIHTMMDGLMVVGPEGTIVSVNPAMERLTLPSLSR